MTPAARNGPLVFLWLGEWISMLSAAADARFVGRIPQGERARWCEQAKIRADDQHRRNVAISSLIGSYPDRMRGLGADFPPEHELALGRFIANASRFSSLIGAWIVAIDDSDVEAVTDTLTGTAAA